MCLERPGNLFCNHLHHVPSRRPVPRRPRPLFAGVQHLKSAILAELGLFGPSVLLRQVDEPGSAPLVPPATVWEGWETTTQI